MSTYCTTLRSSSLYTHVLETDPRVSHTRSIARASRRLASASSSSSSSSLLRSIDWNDRDDDDEDDDGAPGDGERVEKQSDERGARVRRDSRDERRRSIDEQRRRDRARRRDREGATDDAGARWTTLGGDVRGERASERARRMRWDAIDETGRDGGDDGGDGEIYLEKGMCHSSVTVRSASGWGG